MNLVHPSEQVLNSFDKGQLSGDSAKEVRIHLEGCERCRRIVAELASSRRSDYSRIAQSRASTPGLGLGNTSEHSSFREPPAELLTLTQYSDLRPLGQGGMGVVYLAQHTVMDRPVVLKVMNPTTLVRSATDTQERFLREIRAAARLQHPNVVTAYDAYSLGNLLVFAMEYVKGEDLGQLVETRGPLPVANACYYAYQAALGLQHAHEKGMVHRDIKPGNLVLTKSAGKSIIKVLDFGLAKVTSEKRFDGGLTGADRMMGTPDYMAPEQARDAATADIRADVYSLGCTLYYLLSGQPPFPAPSLYAVLQAHQSGNARSLHEIRSEIPVELDAVVRKMMAVDPAQRYSTPAEAARALAPFVKSGNQTSTSSVQKPDQAHPVKSVVPVVVQAISMPDVPSPDPQRVSHWEPPSVFRDLAVPNSTRHLNPEDFNPATRPASNAAKGRKSTKKPQSKLPRWLIPAIAAGIALLLLLVTGLAVSGIFKLRSTEGPLNVQTIEPDAEVLTDGEREIPPHSAVTDTPPGMRPAGRPVMYSEILGATPSQVENWAKTLPRGQRPVWIAARAGVSEPILDAIALPDPERSDWKLRIFPTEAEVASDYHTMGKSGYRPEHVAMFPAGEGDARIWVKDGHGWAIWHSNVEGLNRKLNETVERGNSWPVSLSTGKFGQGIRSNLVLQSWLLNPAPQYQWHPTVSPQQLSELVQAYRKKGWYPLAISPHVGRPVLRYTALFIEPVLMPIEWDFSTNLTEQAYRRESSERKSKGYRPRCLSSAVVNGIVEYTVVWASDPFQESRAGETVAKSLLQRSNTHANRVHASFEGVKFWKDGEELVIEGGKSRWGWLYFGDPEWTDYDFSAQVKFPGPVTGACMFVRLNGEYDGTRFPDSTPAFKRVAALFPFAFNGNSMVAIEGYRDVSQFILKDLPRSSIRNFMQSETWYNVRVQVRGDTVVTYVNNQPIHRGKPPMPRRGCVGLRVVESDTARFKDIRVTDPTGQVLWQGIPDLP